MREPRDQFLSEEDLDLQNLSDEELLAYWTLWLRQAQATNDADAAFYSHGVFERDPEAGDEEWEQRRRPVYCMVDDALQSGNDVLQHRRLEARRQTAGPIGPSTIDLSNRHC